MGTFILSLTLALIATCNTPSRFISIYEKAWCVDQPVLWTKQKGYNYPQTWNDSRKRNFIKRCDCYYKALRREGDRKDNKQDRVLLAEQGYGTDHYQGAYPANNLFMGAGKN